MAEARGVSRVRYNDCVLVCRATNQKRHGFQPSIDWIGLPLGFPLRQPTGHRQIAIGCLVTQQRPATECRITPSAGGPRCPVPPPLATANVVLLRRHFDLLVFQHRQRRAIRFLVECGMMTPRPVTRPLRLSYAHNRLCGHFSPLTTPTITSNSAKCSDSGRRSSAEGYARSCLGSSDDKSANVALDFCIGRRARVILVPNRRLLNFKRKTCGTLRFQFGIAFFRSVE